MSTHIQYIRIHKYNVNDIKQNYRTVSYAGTCMTLFFVMLPCPSKITDTYRHYCQCLRNLMEQLVQLSPYASTLYSSRMDVRRVNRQAHSCHHPSNFANLYKTGSFSSPQHICLINTSFYRVCVLRALIE